ncbi:MAG: archease [Candidatus Aenigmarchaeota archaeon]|nr:archease [Candidatus Aenigmarchaeota archaeon]
MKFRFLDDFATADVAFEAYGKTLNEAFSNSALAMFEVQTDVKTVEPLVSKKVELVSENKESLLFDWLSELLYLRDTSSMFFSKFDIKIEGKDRFKLTGKVFGDKIEGHELRTEVKGVSYQMMKIEDGPEFKIRVILDV